MGHYSTVNRYRFPLPQITREKIHQTVDFLKERNTDADLAFLQTTATALSRVNLKKAIRMQIYKVCGLDGETSAVFRMLEEAFPGCTLQQSSLAILTGYNRPKMAAGSGCGPPQTR